MGIRSDRAGVIGACGTVAARAMDRVGRRRRGARRNAGSASASRPVGRSFGAVRSGGMLVENPLADVKVGSQTNRSRMYFISKEDAAKVLEACPDGEWRLIFALSRFGGLRCPSEHLLLRSQGVDWAKGRVLLRSPKTEGNEGARRGWSRSSPSFVRTCWRRSSGPSPGPST